ncbi:MAG TPA: UDP-3-O-(3-hydroxymyristoyl)glucosamine N-acyltransferase [Myxococcota bacterium]|nr:UDP-3-O-(3-hydroxymyristoyl)glucosamine N-acyltransferase [Myxococcota bacterium]
MTLTLSDLATALGAELRGPDRPVTGVEPLETAGPDSLSLCLERRHVGGLAACRAAGVLLPRALLGLAGDAPCALLVVEDGRLALARALGLLHPAARPEPGLAPGALVDAGARLGPGTRAEPGARVEAGAELGPGCWVQAGAVIGAGAVLGAGCRIGPRAVVDGCCRLGARVRVGAGAVLGGEGFGLARDGARWLRIPQVGRVVLEDDVELGPLCNVDRATLGETRIGAGSQLDAMVHVGHNARVGRGVCIAAQCGLAGSVVIEDGAALGGQVGVADHVTIGAGAQVGAKSGVGSRVPAGARVAGYPAWPVQHWLGSLRALRRLVPRRRGALTREEP